MEIPTFRYEKMIILNDRELMYQMSEMLLQFMRMDAEGKGEIVEFFQLRLKYPDRGMSDRELKLEWVTTKREDAAL